ncbi:MAG: glycerate kinase [Anaerolineales bacterium]
MIQPSQLTTYSLKTNPSGERISRILIAALQAVDPDAAVTRYLRRTGDTLLVTDRSYDLNKFQHIYVVGAGKAGTPMAQATVRILEDKLTAGLVIVKEGHVGNTYPLDSTDVDIIEAGHPIPDQRGFQASNKLIGLVKNALPDDLIVSLVSGGGSALLTIPVEGISLAELQELTDILLVSGATIQEINTLRKHLEQLKGGGLAQLIAPASMITLILSDVVGNPLDIIASGPTVADSSTFDDALAILERRQLVDQVPSSILNHLRRGQDGFIKETPKPGDPVFKNAQNVIIGSNEIAAEAARAQAEVEGFNALLLTTYLEGEAYHIGGTLAAIVRQISATGQPIPPPACVIAGGETTVTIRGDGLGGRNQEVALGAVDGMDGISNAILVTLATDGGDGPTDAAGAVVTGGTRKRAGDLDLLPHDYLTRNDSYNFFEALGDLLITGPTQTNVNDLTFLFVT